MVWYWTVLGLEPTEDVRAIKRAYARLIRDNRPEDDPDGFIRIRQAYEAALEEVDTGRSVPDPDAAEENTDRSVPVPDPPEENTDRAGSRVDAPFRGSREADSSRGRGAKKQDPYTARVLAEQVFREFEIGLRKQGPELALAELHERVCGPDFDSLEGREAIWEVALAKLIRRKDLEPETVFGLEALFSFFDGIRPLTMTEEKILTRLLINARRELGEEEEEIYLAPLPDSGPSDSGSDIGGVVIGIVITLIFVVGPLFKDKIGEWVGAGEQDYTTTYSREVLQDTSDLRGAIKKGDIYRVRGILSRSQHIDLQSCLLLAITYRREAIVGLLLKSGADPNVRTRPDSRYPLEAAIKLDEPGIVKRLLAAGADPDLRGASETPRSLAVRLGREEIIALIQASRKPR